MSHKTESYLSLLVSLCAAWALGCSPGSDLRPADLIEPHSAALVTAATPQMQVQTNTCGTNQQQTFFKVLNTGGTTIPASDIVIKYWIYDTSGASVVAGVSTGGCFTNTTGCFHQVSGVSAKALPILPVHVGDTGRAANWEITITNTDPTLLGSGVSWTNLQLSLRLANYAKFIPGTSTWYSGCRGTPGYGADQRFAIYVHGKLVGGTPVGGSGGCNQRAYRARVVFLVQDLFAPHDEAVTRLTALKAGMSDFFFRATRGIASLDTSDPVALLDYVSQPYIDGVALFQAFKRRYSDNYDYLIVISDYPIGDPEIADQFYWPVYQDVQGIGLQCLNERARFGTQKLRGLVVLDNIVQRYSSDEESLFRFGTYLPSHEIGHNWCCGLGQNYAPDAPAQAIDILDANNGGHYYYGIQGRPGTRTIMNYAGCAWGPAGDGSYQCDPDSTLPFEYHPFTLYMMGLLPEAEYAAKYPIYSVEVDSAGRILSASLHKQISVADIAAKYGTRSCCY